jgi:putative ABC transport system permease protein
MALGVWPDAWTLRRASGVHLFGEGERRTPGMLDTLRRDTRDAWRAVGRNPGFATIAVLTLALGIGANTAIFSVVDAVLLRPLPYPRSDRLVTIASDVGGPSGGGGGLALSYPDYRDVGGLTDAVAGVAAYSDDRYNFADANQPRELQVTRTTADLFSVLGVAPALGRTFSASEAHAPLAVISHALWTESFGGNRNVIGHVISLDDTTFTIVGVMPAGFAFPDASTDVWLPIGWATTAAPALTEMRMYRAFSTIARLAPTASLDTLRRDLDVLGKHITSSGEATSKSGAGETFVAARLRDRLVGDARQPLLILFGAAALVLLVACINAANLLIARANARVREFAVRRAIGAGRRAIVRQVLVESGLLAAAAAGVGLALAALGLHLLAAQLPHGYAARIDGTALGFTILLALATGFGFGVVPALRASAPALERTLRDGTGSTAGRSRRRGRDVLVVSEVALALVLLVGAMLLVRSFVSVNAIDPGFDSQGLLAARIRLTPERYPDASQKRDFYDDLLQRVRALPGVSAVTFADWLPLSGRIRMVGMNPQQIRPDDPDDFLALAAMSVGPDFFSTLRIPIVAGRAFTADDYRAGSSPVCVVDHGLAHQLWPHLNPIGQGGMGGPGSATVIGIVSDVRSDSLERKGAPTIYLPITQTRPRNYDEIWVVVRSAHPLHVVSGLRAAVRAEDATQPIAEITTYDAVVQQQFASLQLMTAVIALFAGLALILAIIGIAGVTAYVVSQRTREFGIRMAVGARGSDLLGLLLSETVGLVAIGLGVGLGAALALTRTLRALLYGVTTTDPATFAAAAGALGLVASVAAYLPAQLAARLDPVEALRRD